MKNFIPMFLAALTLLTGCADLLYKEPLDGPRARVRFATDTDSLAILRTYADAGCLNDESEWMRLSFSGINKSSKRLGMPLWNYQEGAAKEVHVVSSKPLNGLFSGTLYAGQGIYSCGVPFNFLPEENKDYEVLFSMGTQQCSAVISGFVSDNGVVRKQVLKSFGNQLTDDNRTCMQAFNKQRLY